MTMSAKRLIASALFMAGILLPAVAQAQTYTLAPTPFQTSLDDSGNIAVNGCVWTYAAGTSTPIATYSNNAGSLNSNPIIADYAGRFTVYLLSGTNYKFVYEAACSPPSHGTVYRSQDNIAGLPPSAANADVTGVAGETISAGLCTYLSDGSGSKTAGQWFKCDSANTYSSTLPEIGVAVATITSGSTGTIRLTGQVTGLSSLSVGSEYFVGTSGALTSTAPTNSRHVGHADTATTLILTGDPAPPTAPNADNGIDDFRLTLTTGTPVTSTDVTAATTLYCSPYKGNRIALYTSAGVASVYTSAEFSIAVPATTSQMYDVFAYNNAGVATLELLAWTNDTTRATAIVLTTTGTYTKSGDLTRRYVGSFRTTTVSGQTEDSATKRYVWNMYNRVRRPLLKLEATASWTYTLTPFQQARNQATNQVDVVVGVADSPIVLVLTAAGNTGGTLISMSVGIGEDSATTTSAFTVGGTARTSDTVTNFTASLTASLTKIPPVGRHFYAWLEASTASGTTTWFGTPGVTGAATGTANGLSGSIEG